MQSIVRIVEVEAIPLSLPSPMFRSALGSFANLDYGLVVIKTDDGQEGLGEISTLWDGGGHVQCAFVEHVFKPALLGQDARNTNACIRLLDMLVERALPARAAVEMALLDLKARSLNVPVFELLGGRVRERVELSRSIPISEPGEMAARAREFSAAGFRCVKVKLGAGPAQDREAVAAVRGAVGADILVRVDANMAWKTPREAISNIAAIEEFDVHSVEQPLPRTHLSELRFVREHVNTPVMLDESVWDAPEAWNALTSHAADMINVYVAEAGGLMSASLIFRMAELAGVPCLVGAMPEFGVGTAAAVHLAVSMTNLHDPCDACGVIYQEIDIVNESFVIEDGMIAPIDGPGLGVSLNWDAVAEFRVPRDE